MEPIEMAVAQLLPASNSNFSFWCSANIDEVKYADIDGFFEKYLNEVYKCEENSQFAEPSAPIPTYAENNQSSDTTPSNTTEIPQVSTGYLRPIRNKGYLSKFGASRDNGLRAHPAIDFVDKEGTPVYAIADGTLIAYYLYWEGTYAMEVKNNDGTIFLYAEIITTVPGVTQRPKSGQGLTLNIKIKRGDKIGEMIPNTDNGLSMLHLGYYKGTATGPLGNKANTIYDYVPQKKYERRRDLLDPTPIFDLPIW